MGGKGVGRLNSWMVDSSPQGSGMTVMVQVRDGIAVQKGYSGGVGC